MGKTNEINPAAALKFVEAVLSGDAVPVGRHDLSRGRVTIEIPEGAYVERMEGSEGDGQEALGPPESVDALTALLFIEQTGILGPTTFGLWKACAIEAKITKRKVKDVTPPEAKAALQAIHEETPKDKRRTKATPATCSGKADAKVTVERDTITSHKKRPASMSRA
jgi:hypothetical protein